MTSAKTLCVILLLTLGCGDDSTPSLDGAVADATTPRDAGADAQAPASTLAECVSDVGIPEMGDFEPDRFFQRMDFSNEELGIRMRIALSPGPLEQIIGLAINYKTRAFGIESSDGVACVRDESQLTYDVTHHNDTDTLTALVSADQLYSVSMIYDRVDESFTDTLTIEHPLSGAPSDGPYPLVEAGCSVHREDGVGDCTYQARPAY